MSLRAHLQRYSAADWKRAVDTLIGEIHQIDRNATRIWFSFYPLDLYLALEAAPDEEARAVAVRKLGLMGEWRLARQVDASHRFLYAHRYWPQVKSAIEKLDELPPGRSGDAHRHDGGCRDAHRAVRPRVPARDRRRGADDAAAGGRGGVRGRARHHPLVGCGAREVAASGAARPRQGRLAGAVRIHARHRQEVDRDVRRERSGRDVHRDQRSGDRVGRAERQARVSIARYPLHAWRGARFPSSAARRRAARAGSA